MRSRRYGRSRHFIEEQHVTPAGGAKANGVAKRRQDLRERAAEEHPARLARTNRVERRRRQLAERLTAGTPRPANDWRSHPGGAAREAADQHRSVKRDQPAADREKREQRREIAVADERLARAALPPRDPAAAAPAPLP